MLFGGLKVITGVREVLYSLLLNSESLSGGYGYFLFVFR